ncbi:MAG: hypothetical protein L0228_10025 [Planctomycetes bacterium]|nr:hypothetical protein [Planctomycetota bacterium]
MSAEIKVVFTDEGARVPTLPDTVDSPAGTQTTAAPRRAPAPPPPDERVSGPRQRWKGDPGGASPAASKSEVGSRDFTKAAETAAAALGVGGLARQAFALTDAFGRLFAAVTKSAAQLGGTEKTAPLSIDEINPMARLFAKGEGPSGELGPLPSTEDQLFGPGGGKNAAEINDAVRDALENVLGPGRGSVIEGPTGKAVSGLASGAIQGAAKAAPVAGAAAGGAEAAGGVAALGAVAGPAAIAVAALTAAVAAGVVVIQKSWDVLAGEADRLSGLSGPLSAARAGSEVRSEMADLRRANELGPQLARFENTRGRLDEKLADIQTKILGVLLRWFEKAEPAIEAAIAAGDVVAASVPVIADTLEAQLAFMTGGVVGAALDAFANAKERLANLQALQRELVRLTKDQQDDKELVNDPFMQAFLREFADEARARPGVEERAAAFRRAREGMGQPFVPEGGAP